ncbi:MAG: asparagine synthase C-terminal domain-containing protein [Thermoplasmata archaeon]|nr:asparagine synthase C-terminal domain-containing protein [Thermoplasmata archaeon]
MRPAAPSILEAIADRWRTAVDHSSAGERRISVLFSGGLDSSLVAFALRNLADLELVTVGVEGSADLAAAEEGARLLDSAWTSRIIDRNDVERILQEDRTELERTAPVSRAVLVSTALALEATGCGHVVCGQGADELFLGYAHFERLTPLEASERRRTDLEHLMQDDWPRSIRLADRRSKTLTSPFLDPDFFDFVRALPVDELAAGPERKATLRKLAENLGLPAKLVHRPKKAFQYGSGVDRLLRSLRDRG